MKISRHAKNNIRLYQISKTDILKAVESPDITDIEGNNIIYIKKFRNKYSGYPLKVVCKKIEEELFIITSYPLKKKIWR